jgi:hypothetical protein
VWRPASAGPAAAVGGFRVATQSDRVSMNARIARRPALVAGLTMFVVVWTLTTHGKYSADGDEPHYLMVTRSLWADHDIDLANNYGANDGRLFGHDPLEAGAHARVDRRQRLSPVHDLGVSIALVPVYAIAEPIAGLMSEPITAYAWQHPRSLWPVGTSNPLLDALGPVGRAHEYLLPPLTNGQPLLPAVVFLAVVLGLNVLLVTSSNSRRLRSGNRSIA